MMKYFMEYVALLTETTVPQLPPNLPIPAPGLETNPLMFQWQKKLYVNDNTSFNKMLKEIKNNLGVCSIYPVHIHDKIEPINNWPYPRSPTPPLFDDRQHAISRWMGVALPNYCTYIVDLCSMA